MNQEITTENIQKINGKTNLRIRPLIIILISLFIIIGFGVSYYFVFSSNPQRIFNKSINNMAKVKDLHFGEIAFETKTMGEFSKVSGDICFPNNLRINLIPGLKNKETVVVDGKVYTKWLNKWSLIENKKPEEFNFYNPQKFIDLLGYISDIKSLENEKIGDQNMVHLKYVIDKNEAQKVFSKTENNSYKGEVWIGENDGLIHRIAITFIPEKSDEAPRKYQMDFSDFNGNIRIEKPKL